LSLEMSDRRYSYFTTPRGAYPQYIPEVGSAEDARLASEEGRYRQRVLDEMKRTREDECLAKAYTAGRESVIAINRDIYEYENRKAKSSVEKWIKRSLAVFTFSVFGLGSVGAVADGPVGDLATWNGAWGAALGGLASLVFLVIRFVGMVDNG